MTDPDPIQKVPLPDVYQSPVLVDLDPPDVSSEPVTIGPL